MAKQDEGNKKLLIILLWIFWPIGLIWWLVDKDMNKDKFPLTGRLRTAALKFIIIPK